MRLGKLVYTIASTLLYAALLTGCAVPDITAPEKISVLHKAGYDVLVHKKDNVVFPRLLVVRTQGAGEVDVGDVQADDWKRSDFVRRSGLLPFGLPGEKGSLGLPCAGGPVATFFSAFGEQIG
jgi:hypothetical protein